jgi:hypothetical protein
MITFEQVVYVIPILGLTASIFYYAHAWNGRNGEGVYGVHLGMILVLSGDTPALHTRYT